MQRRTALKSLLAAPAASLPAAPAGKLAAHLHTDLHVPAGQEAKLLDDFHRKFLPRISKAPGFLDAKLLKFRQANVGKAPEHFNYRLIQVFETEEQREAWRKTEPHKVAWHEAIESHVKVPFVAFVYEIQGEFKPSR